MRGAHKAEFQDISLEIAVQGCLGKPISHGVYDIGKSDNSPTKQDNHSITFGGNESQHKNILATTVVAFGSRFTKRTLSVEDDFLVLGANEVIDNV